MSEGKSGIEQVAEALESGKIVIHPRTRNMAQNAKYFEAGHLTVAEVAPESPPHD